MSVNLRDIMQRKAILQQIKSEENRQRKAESFKQNEIFSDRQHPFVRQYLAGQFSEESLREIPIISSVNLARRIVKQQASLYRKCPDRTFKNLDPAQTEVINYIYQDMRANVKLAKSNEFFKLQNQNLIQIVPKNGEYVMRVLMNHQYDVIPSDDNPEIADAVIISVYDSQFDRPSGSEVLNTPIGLGGTNQPLFQDNVNLQIGDRDDYRGVLERYVVWTRELNFIMDGQGNIISGENIDSPIPGTLPFIDVSGEKDFQYFNRQGQAVTDFSIQYNGSLSDLANIVRMQGWGQAYLIAESGLIPQNLQIGPNYILKLPVDPNTQVRPEFGFAQAQPDLDGSIKYIELLLSNFLTSRGLDPKTIMGKADGQHYSSGIERLLAMVEKFEASQEDMAIYESVEDEIFDLIVTWNNALTGTGLLSPEYETTQISDEAEVYVKFKRPELIQSEAEQINNVILKVENGLMSHVEAIEELRGVDKEKAMEIISEINSDLKMPVVSKPAVSAQDMKLLSGDNNASDQEGSIES